MVPSKGSVSAAADRSVVAEGTEKTSAYRRFTESDQTSSSSGPSTKSLVEDHDQASIERRRSCDKRLCEIWELLAWNWMLNGFAIILLRWGSGKDLDLFGEFTSACFSFLWLHGASFQVRADNGVNPQSAFQGSKAFFAMLVYQTVTSTSWIIHYVLDIVVLSAAVSPSWNDLSSGTFAKSCVVAAIAYLCYSVTRFAFLQYKWLGEVRALREEENVHEGRN